MCCNYIILKYFVSGWSGVVAGLANPSWFSVLFIIFKVYVEGHNNWLTENVFCCRINLRTRKLHQRGRRGLKENRQKRQIKNRQRTTCLQKMGKLKLRRWSLEGWVWVCCYWEVGGVFCYKSFWNILFLGPGKSLEWKPRIDLSKVEVTLRDTAGRKDRLVQGQSTAINELLLLEKWLCQVSLGCTTLPEWLNFLEALVRSLTASSTLYYTAGMQTWSYKFRTRSAGKSRASTRASGWNRSVVTGLELVSGFCDSECPLIFRSSAEYFGFR